MRENLTYLVLATKQSKRMPLIYDGVVLDCINDEFKVTQEMLGVHFAMVCCSNGLSKLYWWCQA